MDLKIRLQPLKVGTGVDYAGLPVMAAEAWTNGPVKPREALRKQEKPERDVSLANLSKLYDWVQVAERRSVPDLATAREVARSDVDAFLVSAASTVEVGPLLAALTAGGTPAIAAWDDWGFAWSGRSIWAWSEVLGFSTFVPVGAEDVETLLRALRAVRSVRQMRILYIGDIPSHSVNADTDPTSLYQQFGCEFQRIGMDEYVLAVQQADRERTEQVAKAWSGRFNVMDGREPVMAKYAAIYVALQDLLAQHACTALTVDCAYLPNVELVPCVAASLLVDDGFAWGCEGDTNQLLTQQMLMGVSGHSALMGNLFANATHADVLDNAIVINHDVVPPSMARADQSTNLRDFHQTSQGSTLYADLPQEAVTMGGLSFDSSTLWLSKGRVIWTEDTTHCRLSVGIRVEDAKRIFRNALGHHQVFTYGSYLPAAKLAGEFLGLKTVVL